MISNAFFSLENASKMFFCHATILISYFRDEYPDLECPLHLRGSACCERYFSENGSFMQNRHNYTFLDMHTNLGHMNRLEEIKATNQTSSLQYASITMTLPGTSNFAKIKGNEYVTLRIIHLKKKLCVPGKKE